MNAFRTTLLPFRSALAGLALAASAAPALAADVGVSVNVAAPGVYGRVDIGRAPPPAVVYREPIVVQPPPRRTMPQPVYMWVPPGHQRHWQRHCAQYGACGVPVYFVQDRWYREHVRPDRGGWRGDARGPGRDHDWDRDGDRGHGHGHGHRH